MATYNTGTNTSTNNVFLNVKRITIKGISFDITVKSPALASKEESTKYAEFFNDNLEAVQEAIKDRLELTGADVSGAAASRTFDASSEI